MWTEWVLIWIEWVLIWIEWSEYFCPYKDEKNSIRI